MTTKTRIVPAWDVTWLLNDWLFPERREARLPSVGGPVPLRTTAPSTAPRRSRRPRRVIVRV
jgi:hypothetical protein